MSVSLLLLDMEVCVRRCLSNPGGHINQPDDQGVMDEASVALARWKVAGFTIVGLSNQQGVEAGYKTLGECVDEQLHTLSMAPELDAVFCSPDADGSRCLYVSRDSLQTIRTTTFKELNVRSFRMPAAGMVMAAMLRYGAKPDDTIVVGDVDQARLAAIDAGADWMLHRMFLDGETQPMGRVA